MLKKIASALFISTVLFSSCKKDDPIVIPPYTIPTTYNFANVENREAAVRVSMWAGYQGILGKSNTRQLSQDTINNLWNNANNAFTAETGNTLPYTFDVLNALGTSFSLSSKTADAAAFKILADSMVNISQYYNTPASRGVAGKIGSRIFNYRGLEFNQSVAKGLMGALQLHNVILHLDASRNADNSAEVAGQGTAMQHQWDMAFGYAGIPKTYDTSIAYNNTMADRPLAIGGYFAERGKYIQSGYKVFEAFRKGRAAIGANDYAVRDAAIVTIKEYLEKTIAAALYYYVTAAQTQADLAAKFHSLSEAHGFALGLKYRAASSPLTNANLQALLAILNTDYYVLADDATNTLLKQGQTILNTTYGQLQP